MFLFTTLFISLITVFLYFYWYIKKSYQFFHQYGIPYIEPHWLFGNMKDVIFMRISAWEGFNQMHQKLDPHRFGGVYTFQKPTVLIRDPELIKTILVKDFGYFQNRGFTVVKEVEPLAYHLFNMQGDEWKNLRIKLTGTFTSGKMKMMFPLIKSCAEGLKPVLMKYSQNGSDFDVKDLCARLTTDIIGSCAFGIDTNSLQEPDSEFRRMCDRIFKFRWQTIIRTYFPHMPASYIKALRLEFLEKPVHNFFMKIVEDMVKNREENNVTRGDFLDILISLKNQTDMEKIKEQGEADLAKFMSQIGEKHVKHDAEITPEVMAAQCLLFFVAGFDTTSTALMFMLFELGSNLDIQEKLRQEILSTIEENGGEISYEMMRKMPYLEMIIAEILRKYPPAPILIRKCGENYKIPDSEAIIKEGTPVFISTLGLHCDSKYYEKPLDFYPEHFTKEAISKRPHHAYLPFGEGPRMCIAERFARMQIIVGIIYLLKDFSFEVSSKTITPLEYAPSIGNVNVKGGIWLKCQPVQ
ncbi:probable cytochrome P450 6a21 [Planococcus citri]|uniref:probable cytochrome P450 6a21 n=1 Tax=Planococcus citri TaxID=170843 RepID=UPI0031F9B10C